MRWVGGTFNEASRFWINRALPRWVPSNNKPLQTAFGGHKFDEITEEGFGHLEKDLIDCSLEDKKVGVFFLEWKGLDGGG